MCRDGKAYEMSADHKPEDEIELNRIKNAGGKVTPDGRVNGGLNLSRAIGNFYHSLSMIEVIILTTNLLWEVLPKANKG